MKDVTGTELVVGDKVVFTCCNDGAIRFGRVTMVKAYKVEISYSRWQGNMSLTTKRQSKFILKTGSEGEDE